MDNLIKFILYFISLLCLYIILTVGLDWLPKLGNSENFENINQVSINLSYSFIAGLIFYFFISYFPYLLNKEKLKPTIDFKINDLSLQFCSYIQTFKEQQININIDQINLTTIEILIKNKSLLDDSYYSKILAIKMNHLEFINETKTNIFNHIDSILLYKEYLNSEQILNIEKIKDSKFFHLIKPNYNNRLGNAYYNSELFKKDFANELNEIFKAIKQIRK